MQNEPEFELKNIEPLDKNHKSQISELDQDLFDSYAYGLEKDLLQELMETDRLKRFKNNIFRRSAFFCKIILTIAIVVAFLHDIAGFTWLHPFMVLISVCFLLPMFMFIKVVFSSVQLKLGPKSKSDNIWRISDFLKSRLGYLDINLFSPDFLNKGIIQLQVMPINELRDFMEKLNQGRVLEGSDK